MPTARQPQDAKAAQQELRELAKTLNQQLMDLTHSVAEVRYLLYAKARRIKKLSKEQSRPVSRPLIAPITVFHGKGGRSTAVGHECTEAPVDHESYAHGRE